ncbi:carbon-nitrogen hydrolase family protein [Nocardioides sp. Bht2]|uniref:carbon-nitrogen hydrolase family protein n=1 Tax=Nocardioides sp. Bht2 TaxID=3392297 RepID=UPI0039B39E39
MRIAVGQGTAEAGEIAVNVASSARLARSAADAGAELLVLPEAFLSGYCRASFEAAPPTLAALTVALTPLAQVARERQLTVVVSTPVQREQSRTLSTVVVRPDGSVSAPYDKQHLSGYEHDYFVAGTHGASISLGTVEAGLAICYDSSFPEHARAAAVDGAVLYAISAAFFPGGGHRRDLYAASRALDNGMYVAFSGLTGSCGDEQFIGGSAIYDPEGRCLARLGTDEGVVVAELDPAVVAQTRRDHPMLADLRDLGPRQR